MPYKDRTKQRAYQLASNSNRRRFWFWMLGNKCSKCGGNETLELDHIDPATKINHRIWSWSLKRIQEEIKKCQLLCRNCHIKKSAKEKTQPLIHGSGTAYKKGCRCDFCRQVRINYKKSWRDSRRKLGLRIT